MHNLKPLKRKKKCWTTGKPYEAKTFNAICRLQRDNLQFDWGWFALNGDTVSLATQRTGEPAKHIASIPRKDFLQISRWFVRPQRLRYLSRPKKAV